MHYNNINCTAVLKETIAMDADRSCHILVVMLYSQKNLIHGHKLSMHGFVRILWIVLEDNYK